MLNFIRKSMLVGIGLTSMAEERIRKLVTSWIEKGELTEEEGKSLVKDITEQAKKSKEELDEKISREVSKVLAKMNLATKKEVDELKEKVEKVSGKTQT